MKELQQKLQDLKQALAEKSISVNEYCSFYTATCKQIKNLKKS